MDMPKIKVSEQIAKIVIERIVPGSKMHYREQQANREPDFDLVYPDGLTVPVEVTESTNQRLEAGNAALAKNYSVPAKLCRYSWYVHPFSDARINMIRTEIDQHLSAIEADGLDPFWIQDTLRFPNVARIINDLRIGYGTSYSAPNPPGQITIFPLGHDRMVRVESDCVLEAIETEACNNREKLAAIDAPERHLFVLVSPVNYPAWVPIVNGGLPNRSPSLPREISDLWVGAPDRLPNCHVVLRWKKCDKWRNLGRILTIPL